MAVLLLGGLTVTGIGFAAASVLHRGPQDTCADGTPRTTLNITTAPSLATPVNQLATAFSRAHSSGAAGACVSLTVTSTPSDRALDALAHMNGSDTASPDVWIPESADWLELGQESTATAQQLPTRATTIAGSPVVIAMPRDKAQVLGWPERHMTWADLSAAATTPGFWAAHGQPGWGEFRLAMANPENSTAALRAVIGTVSTGRAVAPAEMTAGTFDQDRGAQAVVLRLEHSISWLPQYDSQLFAALRTGSAGGDGVAGSTASVGADGQADTAQTGGGPAPSAFPALESDVIAYNRGLTAGNSTSLAVSLVASYPSDGSFTATVPYVVLTRTSDQEAKHAAASSFLDYVRGDAGRRALTTAGFRTPAELDGQDDPGGLASTLSVVDGVRATPPKLASTDASDTVLGTARRFFRHARQRAATLVALDTSGSMALGTSGSMALGRIDDPGRTRLRTAADIIQNGLALFDGDNQAELWQFSGELPGGHRVLAPMAPLDSPGRVGTHRDDLTAAPGSLRPSGVTDLYSTIVTAVRDRTQHHVAGRLNEVIVLTDGDATDADAGTAAGGDRRRTVATNEPTLDQAVASIRGAFDPRHPVQLIIIACDPAADMTSLQRLADAGGGRAYRAPDANALFGIYVDTLTQTTS
ncbi:substrate-binding and VWA domain-containing protein [Frankia canadensis]|uniref:substrate-binding and VWA domain-containing protein n=1 Tax=Frankia canadensis TaxID=1836972 RepID=UPI001FAF834B|nr:substrate-binding and VWA domain-containing protein [Frankia canadensis]